MASRSPVVGYWYQSKSSGEIFEVVAIDEQLGCIEIQYRSGDIDEIETEEWPGLRAVLTVQPDDGDELAYGDDELEESHEENDLWGLHLNDMDLQGFDTLDWREPL